MEDKQFNDELIKQIADDLQSEFQDDIINLKNDDHRNRVRSFLHIKGYPSHFIDKYIQSLHNRAYSSKSSLDNLQEN